jgi:hypothetical protein
VPPRLHHLLVRPPVSSSVCFLLHIRAVVSSLTRALSLCRFACSTCKLCSPGQFAATSGQSACRLCPAGQYSFAAGASTCNNCSTGSFNPLPGSSLPCQVCPTGTFNANMGSSLASACQPCPKGTFAGTGSRLCQACPSGRFNSVAASASCQDCPQGSYNPATGSVSLSDCAPCDPGTYNAVVGQPACPSCPVGRYGAAPGASDIADCQACPLGTYSAVVGAAGLTSCVDCEPGRFSAAAAGARTLPDLFGRLLYCVAGKSQLHRMPCRLLLHRRNFAAVPLPCRRVVVVNSHARCYCHIALCLSRMHFLQVALALSCPLKPLCAPESAPLGDLAVPERRVPSARRDCVRRAGGAPADNPTAPAPVCVPSGLSLLPVVVHVSRISNVSVALFQGFALRASSVRRAAPARRRPRAVLARGVRRALLTPSPVLPVMRSCACPTHCVLMFRRACSMHYLHRQAASESPVLPPPPTAMAPALPVAGDSSANRVRSAVVRAMLAALVDPALHRLPAPVWTVCVKLRCMRRSVHSCRPSCRALLGWLLVPCRFRELHRTGLRRRLVLRARRCVPFALPGGHLWQLSHGAVCVV